MFCPPSALYVIHIQSVAAVDPDVATEGKRLISYMCCLLCGLLLVYYISRTNEMILREHFKAQHLAAYLLQVVRSPLHLDGYSPSTLTNPKPHLAKHPERQSPRLDILTRSPHPVPFPLGQAGAGNE